jgi:three-Cys-motif partner protein
MFFAGGTLLSYSGNNMTRHEFGGDWTTEKLERVRKYLVAYTTIFNANERARYLIPTYVDAFAGTGGRSQPQRAKAHNLLFPELSEHDNQEFLKGSARIALEVSPPFQQYLFIEQDEARATELRRLRDDYPTKADRIQIEVADANSYLTTWCANTDWKRHRAVVFLDPYGMQVEWSLIETLANTHAIDLWLLFPLGMAVNRLLTRSEPPPLEWANSLTRIFGTETWREAFYAQSPQLSLFGNEIPQSKQANFEAIGRFFVGRLKTVFAAVADNPLPLYNSRRVPLYLLCFAAGNPQVAPIAVKIAQNILGR